MSLQERDLQAVGVTGSRCPTASREKSAESLLAAHRQLRQRTQPLAVGKVIAACSEASNVSPVTTPGADARGARWAGDGDWHVGGHGKSWNLYFLVGSCQMVPKMGKFAATLADYFWIRGQIPNGG